ncbi:MAG: TRAP transporter small permease [Oceanospirillales bacterium]|nr:TRAP transporter small permease [Oceanospirillales bacterium]MBR9886211.1 TRAP transporter small permease [Oceanospirillales bacterium]
MTGLLSFIEKVDMLLALIVKPIVVVISLAIAFMLSYGIFSRAVLGTPVFGLEELILMGAMWLYMLGAVLASRDRSHLCADFVQVITDNQRIVTFMHLLATLVSLFMAVMFATWSYDLMLWGLKKGQTTTVFHLPWYLSQSSLFVASTLFIFYLIRDFCNDLLSFRNSQSS